MRTTTKQAGFCSTSLFVGISGLAVTGLLFFQYPVFAAVVSGFVGIILLLVMCGPIPRFLARKLQDEYFKIDPNNFGTNNVIVMLGDFTVKAGRGENQIPSVFAYSRINKTVELYRAAKNVGAACRVLIAGDDSAGLGATSASVYAKRIVALGVEGEDITVEPVAYNSYAHAKQTNEILSGWRYDRLFLVTSGLHLRRAVVYFENFGLTPKPVASDYTAAPLSFVPISYNLLLTDIAIHQWIGVFRLTIYNRLGLNK